ncbi:sphingosine hydroxylase [Cristinia sonorae]|uniref:Sphingosine hydroxylase n=1 Tax=Cristinia sonorae TaxID=1940300 RepID=A0A8K0XMI3_9AGAR|nr:sphingosine hydroxylase [Cristinia sonorae]
MNSTTKLLTSHQQDYLSTHTPFYYSPHPNLFPSFSDVYLSLAAPVLAYWISSCFFHVLDVSDWRWLDRYRLHESAEVKSRNLVTRTEVLKAVIFQQIIQTILGLWWMEDTISGAGIDHVGRMAAMLPGLTNILKRVLGDSLAASCLENYGSQLLYTMYWWAIPIAKFFLGMFIIDTWQYFLHRGMHMNTYLYKKLHSVHHRLYVPYAFGALYNHPVEGFLLDTLGAVIAESIAHMSVREAMLLFTISSFKTVDDHCGYCLPWDPLQMFSGNTADYHDIHHQIIGIKSNFSQPFFVHWDVLLGTRMTREDIAARRRRD